MNGRIVHRPEPGHTCRPPALWVWRAWWRYGTVWECGCGRQYVLEMHPRSGCWHKVWRALPADEYIES